MRSANEYSGLRHVFRLWTCRTFLRLTRWAYRPYPINVILRRVAPTDLCAHSPLGDPARGSHVSRTQEHGSFEKSR